MIVYAVLKIKKLMTGTHGDCAALKRHAGFWEIHSSQVVLSHRVLSSVSVADAWESEKCWSSVLGWMTLELWETKMSYFDSGFVSVCMTESCEALESVSKHNLHICKKYQQCLHDFVQETYLKCSSPFSFFPAYQKAKGNMEHHASMMGKGFGGIYFWVDALIYLLVYYMRVIFH